MRERDHPGHELMLGEIRVRVRRNPGAGVPPYLWDVMDGPAVAETFASVPSQADAEAAIRRRREGSTPGQRLAEAMARAGAAEGVRREALETRYGIRRRPRKPRSTPEA